MQSRVGQADSQMIKKLINPAWAIVEYAWYPSMVFAATPYFLKSLGPDGYGLWMLLSATVGVGAIFNVGTGAATIKLVAEKFGINGHNDLNAIVGNALAVAALSGGALAFFVLAVFRFGGGQLFAKMGDDQLVFLTGAVAALLGWIEQIDNVFSASIKGAEKYGQVARVEMASKALQMAMALVAVTLGGGIVAVFSVLIVISIFRLMVKARLARSLLGLSSIRPRCAKLGMFLRLSKWGWLQGLGGIFFASADRFLVGSMYGASTLSHYSIVSMLPQQIHAMSAAGMSVVFPMVTRKRASDASFSLARPALTMLCCNLIVSGLLAIGLWFFGERILALWLNESLPADYLLTYKYLVVAYFLLTASVVPHFLLLGMGRMQFVAVNACVAGVVAVLIMGELAQRLGLSGVGAARIFYGALYGLGVCAFFLPQALRLLRRTT